MTLGRQRDDRPDSNGWTLYFPDDEYNEGDPKAAIVNILTQFFTTNSAVYVNADEARLRSRVTYNFQHLKDDIPVADFDSVLRAEPHTVLACLGLATYRALRAMEVPFELSKINVRLDRYSPLTALKDLKSNLVEKFVSIRGNVVRVGPVRPLVIGITFDCRKCGARIPISFPDGRFTLPSGCPTQNCRTRAFEPDRASARTIDFQRIHLQEIMGSESADAGRIPRSIECELTEDLVDSCIPGDVVTVCGVVKAFKADNAGGNSRDKNKSLFMLYLEVKSVNSVSDKGDGIDDTSVANINAAGELQQFSPRDLEGIRAVASSPQLFRTLVHSFCPAIFGHEMVKAGLSLALFGGVQKNIGDRQKLLTRGDPHVLVVGDPGLGKSQMLRAACSIAPRSVYVCGTSSTNSGLTVSMVRDGGAGDYALEAGALVLADQGICCIDEFDKMSADHQALFEVMEQQSISIAKAGMVCTLSARTSVLAAANPVGGHYNRAKTVNENLKISGALLSRFDLIFILLDRPDEARDAMLSEHVIALHSKTKSKNRALAFDELNRSRSRAIAFDDISQSTSSQTALIERLHLPASENDPIPPWLFRKYIAYARKFVKPRLSAEAKQVLADFYLHLRRSSRGSDSAPITTRQLESTIRLTEARAKCELREEATAQDAHDVVEIIKTSLQDVLEDQHGQIDFRRGRGMSRGKLCQAFMKALKREAETTDNQTFTEPQLYAVAQKLQLEIDNFSEFVEVLNDQGYLLKRGGRNYQIAI